MKKSPTSAALLLLVAGVHYGYAPLAALLFQPEAHAAASRALFYVLRGVESTALWLLVLALSPRSLLLAVACIWGASEGALTAVCRLALPIGGAAPVAPAFGGMCDVAAGAPVGLLPVLLVLFALCVVQEADPWARSKTKTKTRPPP